MSDRRRRKVFDEVVDAVVVMMSGIPMLAVVRSTIWFGGLLECIQTLPGLSAGLRVGKGVVSGKRGTDDSLSVIKADRATIALQTDGVDQLHLNIGGPTRQHCEVSIVDYKAEAPSHRLKSTEDCQHLCLRKIQHTLAGNVLSTRR